MSKNLIIVESPAKAKTIEKFLGNNYRVKSSFGHIRDLPPKGLNIDIEHDFKPNYEISPGKQKVINELRKLVKDSDVLLASDEDREGEAIAWHLTQVLSLDPSKTKRIVFHEITKPAIEEAINKPRTVDLRLVDAQQARRVLDRLVGYELSPVLWKKVRTGLSAGRVQSVAVRLIVEREREIRNFKSESSFKVSAVFSHDKDLISAVLNTNLPNEDKTAKWLKDIAKDTFKVLNLTTKPARRSPAAPFTTSTLQQEASRRLGFSVRQTMTIAQYLYEAGLITYMRTDSTQLSKLAVDSIGEFINQQYGATYLQSRQYKTKSISAQEAHEAIRPTNISLRTIKGDQTNKKLYELIWKRAVASQMADAKISQSEITIAIGGKPELFIAKGESLLFDGFMKVWGGTKEDVILPLVKKGDVLKLKSLSASEQLSRGPGRYSEASLVRKLERLGIGRPSTYAPTISTIQSRGYVNKTDLEGEVCTVTSLELKGDNLVKSTKQETIGSDKNKLTPTSIAEVTTDFLVKYFPSIVNYDFTAQIEEDFDEIARGKRQWQNMIKDFYKSFHPLIEKTANISRQEVSQARLLGLDPVSKQPIYARFGRFGPMLQRGETTQEEKPEFASMPEGSSIETVTLEQALNMFKLPRVVGKTAKGEKIQANIGRFGPYIKTGKISVSIKGYDPHTIDEVTARQLLTEKVKRESSRLIKDLEQGMKILNGPYGPYITDGKRNVRIDKGKDPALITQQEAEDILAKAPNKKRRYHRKQNK
jgi:DNA topoisomerase-1